MNNNIYQRENETNEEWRLRLINDMPVVNDESAL